jgi:hypothetical protein|tara:strand:+ start:137 stop:370 length:234 start_codon:yes stop_codon:yes gene_type:complete
MSKTFNITRSDVNLIPAPFDFIFEWDDEEKKIHLPVSMHGAMHLIEAFRAAGYKDESKYSELGPFKDYNFILDAKSN